MIKIEFSIVLVLLLAGFLYFFQLGQPSAWDQDEGQMFAASLEMVKSGEYLTPHLNSQIYFHKPPLYAWLTTILYRLFGFHEFFGRFWAAIFGIAGVLLTYIFAKDLYSERTGLLAALVLATSPLYIILAKMGLVDIVLTFFMAAALYCFHLGYKKPTDKKWWYLFYASMAFATMTKGPLGILIPGLSVIIFLITEKNLPFIRKMIPFKGFILYLLIASPWFIIETIREGVYFLKIMFGQFLFSIYFTPFQQHPGPFYYYIIVALLGFVPWSGFLIPAIFRMPNKLILIFAAVMLAFFSLASTKVPGYFLPAFPALAIIVGIYLDEIISEKNKLGFYLGLILPIAILSLSIIVGLNVKTPAEFHNAVIQLEKITFLTLSGFVFALVFSFFKPRPILSIIISAVSISMFFVCLIVILLPYAENFKPSKDLAYALKGYEHVAFYKTWLPPSLIFYLNRQKYPTISIDIQDENNLISFLKQKKSAAYINKEEEKRLKFSHNILKSKAQYAIITLEN